MRDKDVANRNAIIIVNYNSGDLLFRCLCAVEKQLVLPDLVVVVDNASTDESMLAIKHATLETHIVQLPENVGFAAANNIALEKLDGYRFVALLNPDAFPDVKWFGELIGAAERNPEVDSFASRMYRDDERVYLDGAGDAYHFSGLAWREGHGTGGNAEKYAQEREVFAACAGAALYRRNALIAVGGFDERFFCYMEDVDLGYRLRLAGSSCLYVPSATVVHLGSAVTEHVAGFRCYYGHRNLVWVFLKNTPGPLLFMLLPFHFLITFLMFPKMLSRGQGKVYLSAKMDAIKGLSGILESRKVVQASRLVSSYGLLKIFSYRLLSRRQKAI
jgi:GT2 family glycosyltransferase